MVIKLGSVTLADSSARSAAGTPCGPEKLTLSDTPGVTKREYSGADRIKPEHVGCDSGVLSFSVTRIFDSVASALAYIATGYLSEPKEGTLYFDSTTVFAHAAVTSRQLAHVGCAVAIQYTIEG